MSRSSLDTSVLLRGAGAVALLILMFATSWYGLSTGTHGAFGASLSTARGAWQTLSVVRWLLLLAAAGGLISLAVPDPRLADVALGVGAVATVGLFYRLLVVLPDPRAVLDVKIGGYLALVACAALTLGAWEAPSRAGGSPDGDVG